MECQAWAEAKLIAKGELEVPCLCSQQRGAQAGEEVQVMATVVKAAGKRGRKDGLGKAKKTPAKDQRTMS